MARSSEIGIMRLVGATNGFIRGPFFVEGLLLGLLGAIIPIILIGVVYYFIVENFSGQTSFHFIQLLPFSPFIFQLSGLILLIGGLIGMLGSGWSIRKFLKV